MEPSIPIKDPGDGGPPIVVVSVFTFTTWLSTLLRCYTRLFIVQQWGWDDTMIIVAQVMYAATDICSIIYVSLLANKNSLHPSQLYSAISLFIALESFYLLTMIALKISVGLFFLRFLVNEIHRLVIIVTITVAAGVGMAFFLFTIFQCGYPKNGEVLFSKFTSNKCWNPSQQLAFNWTQAIVNAITDVILVALPMATVWKLQLRGREKVTLAGIFALGASAIASLVRLKWVKLSHSVGLDYFADSKTYFIWSNLEQGIGITAASLMTLRKLLHRMLHCLNSRYFSRVSGDMRPNSRAVERRPSWHSIHSLRGGSPNATKMNTLWRERSSRVGSVSEFGEAADNVPGSPRQPSTTHLVG